jgi:hypothetical protein
MLERAAPGVFHAVAGETITLAAVARNNDGVGAAAFKYGTPDNLPQRQVQGHPGCTFEVGAGPHTFTMSVFLVPGLRSARYELCQEDAGGALTPLGVTASPATGPVVQVQIDGRPKAFTKAVTKGAVTSAAKPAAKPAPKPAAKPVPVPTAARGRTPMPRAAPKPLKKAARAAKTRTGSKGRRGR